MEEKLYTSTDIDIARGKGYQDGYELHKENSPWEDAFNRMRPEERRLILKIADQLGKRQYFNAIIYIGELIIECTKGLQKLLNPDDKSI